MGVYLFIIALTNLITIDKYMKAQLEGSISYKSQLFFDFIGPVGAIIGRLLCKFKIKENMKGFILGFIFNFFIVLLILALSL